VGVGRDGDIILSRNGIRALVTSSEGNIRIWSGCAWYEHACHCSTHEVNPRLRSLFAMRRPICRVSSSTRSFFSCRSRISLSAWYCCRTCHHQSNSMPRVIRAIRCHDGRQVDATRGWLAVRVAPPLVIRVDVADAALKRLARTVLEHDHGTGRAEMIQLGMILF